MDIQVVDPRQQRGLLIAKGARIKQIVQNTWLVPSQSQNSGGYVVDTEKGTCSCPDHETRANRCKHIWAVDYARHRVTARDGSSAVVETMRVTYRQPWAAYNAAQWEEKDRVQSLLRSLCDGVQNPVQTGRGRRSFAMSDMIFAATMRTFGGTSVRRAGSDLKTCAEKGLIGRLPRHNTIFDYLQRPDLAPILKTLVCASAAPLASVESKLAIDGTGFGSKVYKRWFDAKYGRQMKEATWVKLHAVVGTHTNVIAAAEVTDGTVNDSPLLPQLLKETAENFDIQEFLGDKGYIGRRNLQAIADVGATPYIAFKKNSRPDGPEVWRKAHHLFAFHREEWLTHYGQRSNVEATFSSMKRKFGGFVRAKKFDAMVNEVLLKCLAHNLSCLVHAIHELGIEPAFWPQKQSESAA